MSDILMQLSGLSSGFTPRTGREGWFEVQSFSFATPRSSDSTGRGYSVEPAPREFTVTRFQDAASAAIFRKAADGSEIREMVVEVFGSGSWVVRYTFSAVLVTSYSVTGAQNGPPLESVTFAASTIKVEVP
ncbi:MAG: type VI secretion system tube protein Hcp [Rubrivivax sp.]